MCRPRLEVADVFHRYGADWRRANAGRVSLAQLQVMSAIEQCRSAALGGHVERCEDCGHSRIAYNSCRNRHCPKCQGAAAKDWLAARETDLLPVGYFHLVFTLPAEIATIAYQNKAVVYNLMFRTAAQTLLTIAADPKHLGARIGATAVLHTWGSAMTHHPHVHIIVPGGDIAGWHALGIWPTRFPLASAGTVPFVPADLPGRARRGSRGGPSGLLRRDRVAASSERVRRVSRAAAQKELVRLAQAALRRARSSARLSRPLHSSRRHLEQPLVALDECGVTFRYKDYRRNGRARFRPMSLAPDEFIRRFLLHVLPKGFHRIRHYGLLASAGCKVNIARARQPIAAPGPSAEPPAADDLADIDIAATDHRPPCPCCGGRMIIVEIFERSGAPRAPPSSDAEIRA